jgi:hypothetical protein
LGVCAVHRPFLIPYRSVQPTDQDLVRDGLSNRARGRPEHLTPKPKDSADWNRSGAHRCDPALSDGAQTGKYPRQAICAKYSIGHDI